MKKQTKNKPIKKYKTKNNKRRKGKLCKHLKSSLLMLIIIGALIMTLSDTLQKNIIKIFFDSNINFNFLCNVLLGFFIILVSLFLIQLFVKSLKIKSILKKPLYKIDIMTGVEFENFLMYHFRKLGYKVKTTPTSNDYGADLILTKNGHRICVQAKRYKSNVGNSAVQEVCAAMAYYKCDSGMVVTNSYFTTNAKNLAKANNIKLWDRDSIVKEFDIRTK